MISSSFATSFSAKPFPDTVKSAPIILRGKVIKSVSESLTFTDGSIHLFTMNDFVISEKIKGSVKENKIRFRQLGGSKDGVEMTISGTASFKPEEDIIVMLEEMSEGSYPLKGMMMGKLTVKKNEQGQELIEGPAIDLDEHPVMREKTDKTNWSLQRLKDLVSLQSKEDGTTTTASDSNAATEMDPSKNSDDSLLKANNESPQDPNQAKLEESSLTLQTNEKGMERSQDQFSLWGVLGLIGLVMLVVVVKRKFRK